MDFKTPPHRRGGTLEDLLQQFGSQRSATSATKARRESSLTPHRKGAVASELQPATHPTLNQLNKLNSAPSDLSDTSTTASSSSSTSDGAEESVCDTDASKDELIRSVRTTSIFYAHLEELKMENRRRDRDDAPRRSARTRKNDILASDTVYYPPPAASKRKISQSPRKLDTTRARLHDEIARKSKARANNFLVANKDHFLPLLPENNYISKLIANEHPASIIKYERLAKQPEGVTASMKPYQLDGLSFLVHLNNNGFSGILSDEMGLGKTLQTLSLFQYLEERDHEMGVNSEELRPYLVICPLIVLNSWVNEAQKWVPGLRVLRYHGTPSERDRLKRVALGLEDQYGNETLQSQDRKTSRKAGVKVSKLPTEAASSSYKIVVTTYDTFKAEQSWFKHSFVWRYVVLDEGHMIKSNVTQISTALKRVASEHRLILTGTPVQNDLMELWSLLAWLLPDVFTDNTQVLFKESFDLARGRANQKTMEDARRLLELLMLRRMKDSPGVDLGLPPKEEVLLYVPLTPMQRFWYTRLLTHVDDAVLDDLFADGKSKELAALEKEKHREGWEETAEIMRQSIKREHSAGVKTSAWQKLMNLVMQLRKCCSHPYLLPGALPDPYYSGQHIIRSSGKLIVLEKLLKHSIAQGKKVLIFSGFTEMLDFCEDMLEMISSLAQDFKYLRLDGSTGRARRNLEMRLFNDKKSKYKVMLLSTRAGGLGINLTTAEDVIFLDEDWNPQATLQAEARAHRIGQTAKVTGTVEEQMMGRIRKKLYLSTKITESMRSVYSEDASASDGSAVDGDVPAMSATQLKTLVRRGAQTLSHPDIDVTEMLSWDLDTMLQKCRDKPADPHQNSDINAEVDEEKWLSVMERVECAVFDGKRYQRKVESKGRKGVADASNIRSDRRKRKEMTVMIDGYEVSKESLDCAKSEAVPTMAGKDPRLAEPVREKRHEYNHEEHCLACFDGPEAGHMVPCKTCPRNFHYDCLHDDYQQKVKGFAGFFCSQHTCCECKKNTTDAGGLMYRCRWCPRGFCEDCLEWSKVELIGGNLPEFEMLGEKSAKTGFYIKCPDCVDDMEDDEDRREWIEGMEKTYGEQYEELLKFQEEEQQRVEQQQDAVQETRRQNAETGTNSKLSVVLLNPHDTHKDEKRLSRAPSLTDNSTNDESGVNTPRAQMSRQSADKKRLKEIDPLFGESREEKRARLDGRYWNVDDDVLLSGPPSSDA
ncbi:hypothetical protein N0V90_006925 [Kalmusia sp. IMI 367209]|nr:hypothetical protein N0V90_006925 [Kalmusia sp. IMI 367209]